MPQISGRVTAEALPFFYMRTEGQSRRAQNADVVWCGMQSRRTESKGRNARRGRRRQRQKPDPHDIRVYVAQSQNLAKRASAHLTSIHNPNGTKLLHTIARKEDMKTTIVCLGTMDLPPDHEDLDCLLCLGEQLWAVFCTLTSFSLHVRKPQLPQANVST